MVLIKGDQHFLQLFILMTLTLSACVTSANTVSPSTSTSTRIDVINLPTIEAPPIHTSTSRTPATYPPIHRPIIPSCNSFTRKCSITSPTTSSSTRPPTTRPPTTHPPTTRPPTTHPPTKRPPTTRPPITRPSTTHPPTTRPPTMHPPTTRPSTTRPPTTRPPTMRPSTTIPPTTCPPTTSFHTSPLPTTTPPRTLPSTTSPSISTTYPPTTLLSETQQPAWCNTTRIGLIHYPTWPAPVSGSVTVTTQCANNAHRTSSSLNVNCTSNGNWSGQIPECECDDGYHVITVDNGRETCQTDTIISSVILLVFVSGEAFLLILSLITIITLARCLIKVHPRKHTHSESTYDKLWVHTSHSSNKLGNNVVTEAKRREYKFDNFTRSSQTIRTYDTVQDRVSVGVPQSFTFEKQGTEKDRKNDIIPSQTSIEIETEQLGNGEGLYNVTGQHPMKIAANIEEESNCSGLMQPSSHNAGTEKLGMQSTERMYFEVGSCDFEEETVFQTHKQDEIPQSGEYSMITMSHRTKKSVDIVEMAPPTTSYSLTSPNEEDTGSSSGFEEGSNDGSLSQQATYNSSKPPVAEDFSKEMHVEGDSSNKRIKSVTSTKNCVAVIKTPQGEKFPEYATVAMNHKTKKSRSVKVVEEIYDVVVNQLPTRKASSSIPPHVEPYAVCTLPALCKAPQNKCATGKDSPPATDEEYNNNQISNE